MTFLVKKRTCDLIALIPVSILSTEHRTDLKTLAVAQVLRAASIFRVSLIALYRDLHGSKRDEELFMKISRYILTPPYLKKLVIPRDPDLKHVGIVPPLTLPLHAISRSDIFTSPRWGLITSVKGGKAEAFIGLDKPCIIHGSRHRVGDIVLLRIERDLGSSYLCTELNVDSVDIYLGPRVEKFPSLLVALSTLCSRSLVIEFTRYGNEPFKLFDALRDLEPGQGICCVFGSPYLDSSEILKREHGVDLPTLARSIGAKHIAINSVVNQGVKSVRAIEALYISLAVLNLALLASSRCT